MASCEHGKEFSKSIHVQRGGLDEWKFWIRQRVGSPESCDPHCPPDRDIFLNRLTHQSTLGLIYVKAAMSLF